MGYMRSTRRELQKADPAGRAMLTKFDRPCLPSSEPLRLVEIKRIPEVACRFENAIRMDPARAIACLTLDDAFA